MKSNFYNYILISFPLEYRYQSLELTYWIFQDSYVQCLQSHRIHQEMNINTNSNAIKGKDIGNVNTMK